MCYILEYLVLPCCTVVCERGFSSMILSIEGPDPAEFYAQSGFRGSALGVQDLIHRRGGLTQLMMSFKIYG